MTTLIVLGVLGLIVFNKMNPNAAVASAQGPGAQTPIIKDATGGALSGVLGSRSRPPEYFQSGNPQYNNVTPPRALHTPRPITQMKVPSATTNRYRVVPVIRVAGTSAVARFPSGQTKPVLGAFVNTRQASRSTTAPEIAQPFWARRLPTR